MASTDLFDFLNDVWGLLPETDRLRFGELWKSYEQTYSSVWTKLLESNLASNIDYVPLYNNERWLKHSFDESTEVSLRATLRGNQDLSKSLNLSVRHLLSFSIDGGSPITVDLRGENPSATRGTEIVSKINAAAGFAFASLEEGGALLRLRSATSGSQSRIEIITSSPSEYDAVAVILGLDPLVLPLQYPKFRFAFALSNKKIVGIPSLQDRIHDDEVVSRLKENIDYMIEFGSGIISFKDPPQVNSYWAKDNQVNFETPYNNFGYLLDIYDRNSPSYLKAIKGLWFAFWTGPRPENIRRSIYLLFGLPTASQSGVVRSVTPTEIVLEYATGGTETFTIPIDLVAEVAAGDEVTRFQPLVSGINVYDKLNAPGFLEREVGRPGVVQFLTEGAVRGTGPDTDETIALKLVEQNTYLPQIDVNAFIRPDISLSNVKTFLRNIQPKSRTFLFQVVVGTFNEQLPMYERMSQEIAFSVEPNLDYNPSLEIEQYHNDDTELYGSTANALDTEVIQPYDDAWIYVWQGTPRRPVLHSPDLPQGDVTVSLGCEVVEIA